MRKKKVVKMICILGLYDPVSSIKSYLIIGSTSYTTSVCYAFLLVNNMIYSIYALVK
jgi:hypothetical protein